MIPALRLRGRTVALVLAILLFGLAVRYATYLLLDEGAAPGRYLQTLCYWTCDWYVTIIEQGYDTVTGIHGAADRANWPYFPAYAASTWLLQVLTGLPVLVAGFVLSNGYVFAAALAGRPLFQRAGAYWLWVFRLLAGPFSFLFSTLYSESLFILLTVLVLVQLQRGNYLAAGLIGALLSATRITGVLIVFAILAQVVIDHRRAGGKWAALPARILTDVRVMLAFVLAPLGLFLYMSFLYLHVGDALAFAHLQISFGRGLDGPVDNLLDVFARPLTTSFRSLQSYALAIAALIGLLLSLALIATRRVPAGLFCALCILVSLTTGIGSMVRFVAGLAPLGIVLTELAARWRWSALVLAALALLAGVALTLGRLNGSEFVM